MSIKLLKRDKCTSKCYILHTKMLVKFKFLNNSYYNSYYNNNIKITYGTLHQQLTFKSFLDRSKYPGIPRELSDK